MIYKIVLTGGPCSGKSTCLESITKKLKNEGYYVINVTETATEIIKNITIPRPDDYEFSLRFQEAILKLQLTKEKISEQFAKIHSLDQDVIILYDRSVLDNPVYLPKLEDFYKMLDNIGEDYYTLAQKYDLVIDLVTVASKYKDEYINDGVRLESNEVAIELDKRTTNAYLSSRNLKIVPPTETIEEKIEIVLQHIHNLINRNFYKNETMDKNIDFNFKDDNLFELDNTLCISRHKETITETFKDDCIYKLIKKEKHNFKPVYELQIYDYENNKTISSIITEAEYTMRMYYECRFDPIEEYEVVHYVNDNELYEIRYTKNEIIDYKKITNVLDKENSLVRK